MIKVEIAKEVKRSDGLWRCLMIMPLIIMLLMMLMLMFNLMLMMPFILMLMIMLLILLSVRLRRLMLILLSLKDDAVADVDAHAANFAKDAANSDDADANFADDF